MANTNKLKMFTEYDDARRPQNDITNDELGRVALSIKNKTPMKESASEIQARRDRVIYNKLVKLVPIIEEAEDAVNARIKIINGANVKVRNFRLSTSFSVESVKSLTTGVMTKLNFNRIEDGVNTPTSLNLNINVNRFLKYSASEAYTILTSTLYKSVMGKDMPKIFDLRRHYPNDHKRDMQTGYGVDIKYTFAYSLAKFKLEIYIARFLKDYSVNNKIRGTVSDIPALSEDIAKAILKNGLTEEAIKDIADGKFVLSTLDGDIKALGTDYESTHTPPERKGNNSNYRGEQTWLNQEQQLEGREQFIKTYIQDESKLNKMYGLLDNNSDERSKTINESLTSDERLKASFNTVKKMFTPYGINRSSANMRNLQDFCTTFSNSYMQAHGLSGVEIKFINDPSNTAIGEYYDCGTSQYIEVNLAKISGDKGIVDLTTTLAHELTHAVDSSYHKVHGQYNKYGGGIVDSISTDISNSGLNGRAYELLKDLNYKCYKADPCEQRARDGEQIGVDFVRQLAGDEFKEEIAKYNKSNSQYQEKVNAVKANLDSYIAEKESEFASLSIDPSSKGYSMIKEKLAYLRERAEIERVNATDKIKGKREEIQKQGKEDSKQKMEQVTTDLDSLSAMMG